MAALVAATSRVGGMIKRGRAVTTKVTKLKNYSEVIFPMKLFLAIGFMRRFLELNIIR